MLDSVSELRGELEQGRRLDAQGLRLDRLTDEMRELRNDLPVQAVAGYWWDSSARPTLPISAHCRWR